MLLLIDNYDSFTHNVARYFRELGAQVTVVRNDHISLDDMHAMALSGIIISPGPCTPSQAGITLEAIAAFAGTLPILGVCLGHQAIGQVFGANVVRANQVMHGKTSMLSHSSQGLFSGLPEQFRVARYHSLVLDPQSMPSSLIVDAWTVNEQGEHEIMAIRHRDLPLWGVQYHPEAIESEYGHDVFQNFLALTYSVKNAHN